MFYEQNLQYSFVHYISVRKEMPLYPISVTYVNMNFNPIFTHYKNGQIYNHKSINCLSFQFTENIYCCHCVCNRCVTIVQVDFSGTIIKLL